MKPVITFSHVTKEFAFHPFYSRTFQEMLVRIVRGRRETRMYHPVDKLAAVKDVSFEIHRGETVGLVGPNGAGKSTILKLASRIIEPTHGRVTVDGNVRALLELGAGFHPDLTGRENILLNASIMGLKRSTIMRRLDDIVAFAELERFIDVPVRHYSSGMYMRLGFSVAVHTDPEILLVDEILAVGDAAFQRKCLERIDALRNEGVTILLVSHNADTVRTMCSRAIWIQAGSVVADGTAESVVGQYLDAVWREIEGDLAQEGRSGVRWGSGRARIVQVRLVDERGDQRQHFVSGRPMVVELWYDALERIADPVFGIAIHRSDGLHVTGPNTNVAGFAIPAIEGQGVVRFHVPAIPLLEGTYYLSVSIHNREDTEMYDYHDRIYPFRIASASEGQRYGLIRLDGRWSWESR